MWKTTVNCNVMATIKQKTHPKNHLIGKPNFITAL